MWLAVPASAETEPVTWRLRLTGEQLRGLQQPTLLLPFM